MAIESGQRLSRCKGMSWRNQGAEQLLQWGSNFKKNLGPSCRYRGNKTGKLDRIAESLFGVEEDTLPFDRLTPPLRLAERSPL